MTKRILIVDDEPSILSGPSKAINKFCNFRGEVKTAGNGKDAVKEVSRCFYDICFLDINLPDLSGLDVMKKINEISPQTKVAIMTACTITGGMKKKIDEGASLFIDKPINLPKVRVFLDQTLREGIEVLNLIQGKEERRQFERRALMKTINYSMSVFDSEEKLKADAIDISDAGIGFKTGYPIECGHVFRFKEGIEHKAGVVKWRMRAGDNYRVGIKFV